MAVTPDDYAALQQLLVRYAQSLDDGDADGVAACFTEDAVFDLPTGPIEGKQALHEWAAAYTPAGRHVVGGSLADVDGDSGTIRSYTLYHDGQAPATVLSVVYEDSVARAGGEWVFSRRNVTEVKGA
jgi:ketosteroid isomerase-like protein